MMAELLRGHRGTSLVCPTMGWMSEKQQRRCSGRRKSIIGEGHREQHSDIENLGWFTRKMMAELLRSHAYSNVDIGERARDGIADRGLV